MAERSPIDEVDDAVEALMADPGAPLPPLSPRLAALLRIAADLRDLPADGFRARLKAELLSAAASADDIRAQLEALAAAPAMVAHDVRAALGGVTEMSMRFLASLNRCTIGVSRFSTLSHWERHPAGDELLHILDGEVEITTLTDEGPVHATAGAGSIFVCPRGLWHRLRPRSPLSLLFATPGDGTEHSSAEDPRVASGPHAFPRPDAPALVAHDLRAALGSLPELTITSSTTAEEADAAVRPLAWLDDQCLLAVMRFAGQTPWERHPDGDELLHALDGDVDVTVLTDEGPVRVNVPGGSIFVCPRGLWHRQLPRPAVTMLFATPAKTTEVSWAEDPRA